MDSPEGIRVKRLFASKIELEDVLNKTFRNTPLLTLELKNAKILFCVYYMRKHLLKCVFIGGDYNLCKLLHVFTVPRIPHTTHTAHILDTGAVPPPPPPQGSLTPPPPPIG